MANARSLNCLSEAGNQKRLQEAALAGAQSAGMNLKQKMRSLLGKVSVLVQPSALREHLSYGAPSCIERHPLTGLSTFRVTGRLRP